MHSGRDRRQDDALSEVVGFVLILAVLMIALSLYMTYTVPAIGREKEIAHMNYIKQQMTDIKVAVDSLWINDKTGFPLYWSIDLGTQGGTSQGGFLSVPLLNPIGSAGTLEVNGRKEETIEIEFVQYPPSMDQSPLILDPRTPLSVNVLFPDSCLDAWVYFVNTTKDGKENVNVTLHRIDKNLYIFTNLTQTPILSNMTITNNLQSFENTTINILSSAYGLDSGLPYPIIMSSSSNCGGIKTYYLGDGIYSQTDTGSLDNPISHPMGSFEYRSRNNYWIPQEYYYQMGGIFLNQTDGMTTLISPKITYPAEGVANKVVINDIEMNPNVKSMISGTGPIQLNISIDKPGRTIVTNVKSVTLTISCQDVVSANKWYETLNRSISGIHPPPTGKIVTFDITAPPDNPLILDYLHVKTNFRLVTNIAK